MDYAVVDIETTGSHAGFGKITEIAIIIYDGRKITDRYITLINPEVAIPHWISSLTGITNEMVEEAPRFYEVARKIYQMLEDKIFVAHNVNFDYNFIREEFRSLGSDINLKKLCTVRLSRKIFPGLPSYSLGNLCKSLNVRINDRHRAFGDAEATAKILGMLIRSDEKGYLTKFLKKSSPETYLPPNLPREQYDGLPESAGVYYFFDNNGKVIYVGKANNIKSRIKGHFSPGSETNRKPRMMEEIHGISYELCGNELVSLLFEANEIKRLWPVYNRAHKWVVLNYGVYAYEDRQGYKRFSISRTKKDEQPLIAFKSHEEARNFMLRMTSQFNLCPKFTGLQNGAGACFDHRIKQCKGACAGKERPGSYNRRVRKFLGTLETSNISLMVLGNGREQGESSVVWIENGTYKGFGFFNDSEQGSDPEELKKYIKKYPDNRDIQRILNAYLRNNKQYKIIPLNKFQSSLFG